MIDYDPTTKTYYRPVDLNTPYALAQDGYDPSDKKAALEKAQEWGERIPIGVIFQKELPVYEDQLPALSKGPLVLLGAAYSLNDDSPSAQVHGNEDALLPTSNRDEGGVNTDDAAVQVRPA